VVRKVFSRKGAKARRKNSDREYSLDSAFAGKTICSNVENDDDDDLVISRTL